jgi:hypothetical protein
VAKLLITNETSLAKIIYTNYFTHDNTVSILVVDLGMRKVVGEIWAVDALLVLLK